MPSIFFDITLSEDKQDMFVAYLLRNNLSFSGIEQNEDGFGLYADLEVDQLTEYQASVEDILEHLAPEKWLINTVKQLEERNWNEEWEKSIKSVDVAPFFIKPDVWQGVVPQNRKVIRLNPKMAFGTGYHETTRLMLKMVADFVKPQQYVIDAGTGTGVLAIAAAMMGAKEVFGFDIDPWSKRNAEENITMNGLSDCITIKEGDQRLLKECKIADIVLANINREVLIQILPILSKYVKYNGNLILSGLLDSDLQKTLVQPILIQKFELLTQNQEGEWLALAFQKTSE